MNALSAMRWGQAARPLGGREPNGDAAWTWTAPGRLQVGVIDGLGHGREAALASQRACDTLAALAGAPLGQLLQALHRALDRTRGAALALGEADLNEGLWTWCGVGNIGGVLIPPHGPHERLSCQSGIVGSNHLPPPRLRSLPLHPGSVVILHSDGLPEIFNLSLPALLPPAALAARLLEAGARGDDDALVWAGRADD